MYTYFSIIIYLVYIYIYYDPSARPQTRDLFKIESKTLLPRSRGSQDLAAKMW